MTTDSQLDISLPSAVDIGDGSSEDIEQALQLAYNAIETLQGEVERIRIATGTAPPP